MLVDYARVYPTDTIPVTPADLIQVLEQRSLNNELIGYYTFGHIEKPAFAQAISVSYALAEPILDSAVQHIYWAEGYDPEDDDCIRQIWLPAKPWEDGAIEITFVSQL